MHYFMSLHLPKCDSGSSKRCSTAVLNLWLMGQSQVIQPAWLPWVQTWWQESSGSFNCRISQSQISGLVRILQAGCCGPVDQIMPVHRVRPQPSGSDSGQIWHAGLGQHARLHPGTNAAHSPVLGQACKLTHTWDLAWGAVLCHSSIPWGHIVWAPLV